MNARQLVSHFLFCSALLILGGNSALNAAVISFEWTGTLEITGVSLNEPLFGVIEPTAPYNFSLTYDTSLAPPPTFTPADSIVGNLGPFAHDIYSYSADGITDTSLTFGTKTWNTSDITTEFNFGLPEPILFDVDIALAVPTRYFLNFGQYFSTPFTGDDGRLFLGGTVGSTLDYIQAAIHVFHDPANFYADGFDFSPTFTVSVIPEPCTFVLTTFSLLLLGPVGWRGRRRA